MPIYFHPSMPVQEIQDYYYTYNDSSWSDEVANEFGSAGFGWHLDIGIQIVRMILSGVFDKLPDLKIITGHWGEGITFMLDRMDYMMPKSITGLKKNISDYYRENIYIIVYFLKFFTLMLFVGFDFQMLSRVLFIYWYFLIYLYYSKGDFWIFQEKE